MPTLGVYLVRHGHAEAGAIGGDVNRSLSGRGRREVRAAGRLVSEQDGLIDLILTSPLVRAVQTAEILAGCVGVDQPVTAQPGIAHPLSTDHLIEIISDVEAGTQGVAVVGHEPTLSILATTLLPDQVSRWRGFAPGQVLALNYDRDARTWAFRWLIQPDGPRRIDALGS